MDKEYLELVNRKKILNGEIDKLNRYLSPIKCFVNTNEKNFKNEDSIKALNIIQEDIDKIELILEEKLAERDEIYRILTKNCNHSIIINKMCPICGEWFYEVPKTANIALEIPSISDRELAYSLFSDYKYTRKNKYLSKIVEIIKEAIQEEDTLSYFETNIEELQYDENVKIKRLKK